MALAQTTKIDTNQQKSKHNDPDSNKPSKLTRWVIAITVSLGALLEVLDTSIVNVALPHMQGNLGATLSEIGWVITGYSVANVVIIPLSAWLGSYFGKKDYFIFSLIGFTLASILCGMANSLPMLVIARITQGLCGGGLLAKAQAILFETFPPEEQAAAQGLFGICVMVGPVLGPTVGGYLTDTFNWRWIFFINIPFGILAVVMSRLFMVKDTPKKTTSVDYLGILLLATFIGSFQTVLEEGQKEDWLSSEFICRLSVIATISFGLFIWQELKAKEPAVDLRVLKYKSLWAGSIFSMVMGIGLYGSTFAVPIFAQSIMHYNAMQTGFLMLPSAIASAIAMPVFAKLSGKIDARILVGLGAIFTAVTMFNLSDINPDSSGDSLYWPLIVRGVAAIFMFMPLTMATIGPLPKDKVASASGFFSLTRQLGGSIGIAAITTILDQRQTFHRSILVENIHLSNPNLLERWQLFSGMLSTNSSDNELAHSGGMAIIESLIQVQAALLSYADCFWLVGMIFLLCLPLVLLLGDGKNLDSAMSGGH